MKWKMGMMVVLLLCAVMATAAANAETQTGQCGDNLTYTLTDDGTLTISGTGNMYDYWYTTPFPTNLFRTLLLKKE